MKKTILMITLFAAGLVYAKEYHVAKNGAAGNDGSLTSPLLTVQAASELAQPGDIITVHKGTYRERIDPPRGGTSDNQRITYRANPGEEVILTGSETAKNWIRETGNLWRATLPNSMFGSFNPFRDTLFGDWFDNKGRRIHSGAVYYNGVWMLEAVSKKELDISAGTTGKTGKWFSQVSADSTTIWGVFESNPNEQKVEIAARQSVFYPRVTGRNFITVRGFIMRHAATPWSPPTAEQIGLIGTNWSKGWIIENNTISQSMCVGITLGKYGDEFDNTSASTAGGYVETINRALKNGWNKATIGSHIVRNNSIFNCEQAGIVGSLGGVFSTITGNTIYDIHQYQLFSGAEQAGIKIHASIDMEISNNHLFKVCRGIWLDWMSQGTRVTQNILHDNSWDDIFLEVNHGPTLVDNNLLLSGKSVNSWSSGNAFVHNLLAGKVLVQSQGRQTPYHVPHSTEVAALHSTPSGDSRWYNNIFLGSTSDMSVYDNTQLPNFMSGNVFLNGAKPCKAETSPLVLSTYNPGLKLTQAKDSVYLEASFDEAWRTARNRSIITSTILGKVNVVNVLFEDPAGNPISIDSDFFGKSRNKTNPFPGPFEQAIKGKVLIFGGNVPVTGVLPGTRVYQSAMMPEVTSIQLRKIAGGRQIVIQKKMAGKATVLFNISGRQIPDPHGVKR